MEVHKNYDAHTKKRNITNIVMKKRANFFGLVFCMNHKSAAKEYHETSLGAQTKT